LFKAKMSVDAAKKAGNRIIVVASGKGNKVDQEEVNYIASSQSDVFTIRGYEKLPNFIDQFVSRTCQGNAFYSSYLFIVHYPINLNK
jgi:hypothetical protein